MQQEKFKAVFAIPRPRQGKKTFWHLQDKKRYPSEYELVTSKVLPYDHKLGLAVRTPVAEWMAKYLAQSSIDCQDWDKFSDPRKTTYTLYNQLQSKRENYIEGLFQSIESSQYDRKISPAWLQTLERIMAPLRYPLHGLQMVAAYLGQMAPSGRIVMTTMFQSADEMRRIQCLAYRMALLQQTYPTWGKRSQDTWERDEIFAPLREVVEKLLITYNWGESLTVLNLILKPLWEKIFFADMAVVCRNNGDFYLAELLNSLHEDGKWHWDWTRSFFTFLLNENPHQQDRVDQWVCIWAPLVLRALQNFCFLQDKSAGDLHLELKKYHQDLLSDLFASGDGVERDERPNGQG